MPKFFPDIPICSCFPTNVLPSIQAQNCLIGLQLVSYNPEGVGGGTLKERFGRGVVEAFKP